MALELARSGAAIAGVVGFHSGLATVAPQDAKNIKGKVLVCVGADDPSIPPDQRSAFEREMREGGVDWQMNIYGGVVHSFTNPRLIKEGSLSGHATMPRPTPGPGLRCALSLKRCSGCLFDARRPR
jgi:dienelactone hydrolase